MATPPKWLVYYMYVPSLSAKVVSRETQFGSLCLYLLSSSGLIGAAVDSVFRVLRICRGTVRN